MSIVVVGGGAIGLLVAGGLARAGAEVALLGRASTRTALAGKSLQISGKAGVHQVQLQVADSPEALPSALRQPGLAILCVKSYDTAAALTTLTALDPGQILTLQNGLGNEELLADQFGSVRVIAGAITSSVEPAAPDHIVVTKRGGIGLAPVSPGGTLSNHASLLRRAGFTIKLYDDYRALKWSKALLNMVGNATAAILALPVEQVYADPRLIMLERRALLEALAVMERMGARPVNLPRYPAALLAIAVRRLPRSILFPLLRRFAAGGRGGKDPSLLRDLRQGRRHSEGEYLYGAVAARAAELGLPAPVNAALWRILRALVVGEHAWEEFRGKPERLIAAVNYSSSAVS